MKIADKISWFYFISALIVSCVSAFSVYMVEKNNLQQSIYNNLSIAVDSRTKHIETYLAMLDISVNQLAKSPTLEKVLVLDQTQEINNNPSYILANDRLKSTEQVNQEVTEFLLLNKVGKVISASNEKDIGLDKSDDAYFLGAQKKTFIKDVYYSQNEGKYLMSVSTPFLNTKSGEYLGVLVALTNLDDLNNIVTDRTGLGTTGEIYIVNKYGYMITPSRFIENVVLKQRVNTENVKQAREHTDPLITQYAKTMFTVFPDYRGIMVLGMHGYIPLMQWSVLAEMNEAEAFEPLNTLRTTLLLVILIVPLIAWILGKYIGQYITKPMYRLFEGTQIIGSGNLDYSVGTNTNDEIGQLSRAFDEMTKNLKLKTMSVLEMEKFNKLTVGREIRMIELKNRIADLEKELKNRLS